MNFRTHFCALVAVAAMSASITAQARDYDLAQATCGDVINADPEDADLYFAWVVGYLAGKSPAKAGMKATDVKGAPFERLMKRMRKYCDDHPEVMLMKTIQEFQVK